MNRCLALRSVRAVFVVLLVVLAWTVRGAAATAVPAESSSSSSYDAPADSSALTSVESLDGVAADRPSQALVAGSASEVSAVWAGFVAADSGIGIDESINTSVSAQRQARHVLDSPSYNGGGYFKDASDAQRVLDAYHSGDASILRTTSNGNVIVRYRGVTGYNNNPGAGYLNQPTDVFMIKGTKSVSVVPFSPGG